MQKMKTKFKQEKTCPKILVFTRRMANFHHKVLIQIRCLFKLIKELETMLPNEVTLSLEVFNSIEEHVNLPPNNSYSMPQESTLPVPDIDERKAAIFYLAGDIMETIKNQNLNHLSGNGINIDARILCEVLYEITHIFDSFGRISSGTPSPTEPDSALEGEERSELSYN